MNAFENSSPLSKILYLFVFCLAGLFFAASLVTLINGFVGVQVMQSAWGLRLSSAIQMVLMFLLPAVTLIIWSGDDFFIFLKPSRFNNSFVLYLLAFIILIVGMPFISLLSQINQMLALPEWLSGLELWMQNLEQSAQVTTNLLLEGTSFWDYLGNIIFVGVFAAVAEEFFFRGVLQQLLVKLFNNKHTGVWIGALIFSLMHMQFYGLLPRIVLGVMLGYLYLYSNNLWIPIFVHFINNALVVTFSFFFKENSIYQVLENPSISLFFIGLSLISLGLLIYLFSLFRTIDDNRFERE